MGKRLNPVYVEELLSITHDAIEELQRTPPSTRRRYSKHPNLRASRNLRLAARRLRTCCTLLSAIASAWRIEFAIAEDFSACAADEILTATGRHWSDLSLFLDAIRTRAIIREERTRLCSAGEKCCEKRPFTHSSLTMKDFAANLRRAIVNIVGVMDRVDIQEAADSWDLETLRPVSDGIEFLEQVDRAMWAFRFDRLLPPDCKAIRELSGIVDRMCKQLGMAIGGSYGDASFDVGLRTYGDRVCRIVTCYEGRWLRFAEKYGDRFQKEVEGLHSAILLPSRFTEPFMPATFVRFDSPDAEGTARHASPASRMVRPTKPLAVSTISQRVGLDPSAVRKTIKVSKAWSKMGPRKWVGDLDHPDMRLDFRDALSRYACNPHPHHPNGQFGQQKEEKKANRAIG